MTELAFRITEPGKPSREVPIKVGVSLGRAEENTIPLDDSKVSGRHAHVVEKDGGLVIEDLGSSNHTHILGGSSLKGGESHALTSGTMIQMGDTKLVVTAAGDSGGDKTVAAQIINLDEPREEGGAAMNLALLAAFKAARPRLVIANEAIRCMAPIDKVNFIIGRKGEGTSLVLEHKAVSTAHAAITFENRRFHVEDLGSSNGTFVDGERLESGQKQELVSESHLRFGSVDALFVIEADAEGRSADHKRYRNAVEVLISEGTLPESQRDDAVREAQASGHHPGEILLQKGLITVDDWLKAFKKAEFFVARGGSSSASTGGGRGRGLLVGIIIVLILLIGLILAKPDLFNLGG